MDQDPQHLEFRLDFAPDARLLSSVRLFAASVAEQLGCSEEEVVDLRIAISEACTNAVQAHGRADVDDRIRVVAHGSEDSIVYEVSDSGRGFEHEGEDPNTAFSRVSQDPVSGPGIGLALIRTLFPDAHVEPTPSGTRVRVEVDRGVR